MQTPRENDGNVFTISTVIKAVLGLVALCLTCTAHAQTETWTNTGGSSWTSTNNWSNNTVPTAFGVAEFDADPTSTGSNSGVGPTFLTTGNTAVNNGTYTGAEGTLPDQAVGAISVTSSHTTTSLYIGSTGTTNAGGYMTFNGATVGGIANTIISDMATTNLHIQNEVHGGLGIFGVVLGSTNNIVQIGAGTSSANGASVEIFSTIDQVNAGSSISLYGGGTGSLNGGVLELGGTNSFTGGITIGQSGGTQAGTVQIDSPSAIPATGGIVVNTNSALLLNASGTYGALGQMLTLNGPGTVLNSGALQTAGGGVTETWQGNVTLASNSYISVSNSAGSLTLSGTLNDGGFQLQKQGSGNLILSGDNNMTGSTNIGNGTITVNAGSSIGPGSLVMNAGSGNNTALTLNNGAQTIGSLEQPLFLGHGNPNHHAEFDCADDQRNGNDQLRPRERELVIDAGDEHDYWQRQRDSRGSQHRHP